MKTKLACASLFLFALAAPVLGQQNFVRLDDDKSPCRRFKMIVLVPAENKLVDQNVRKPAESIDPKMVWNPCPQSNVSVAVIQTPMPIIPAPKRWGNFILPELGSLNLESPPRIRTLPGPSPGLPKREP